MAGDIQDEHRAGRICRWHSVITPSTEVVALIPLLVASALVAQVPGRELTGSSSNGSTQIRMETEGGAGTDPTGRVQAEAQQWSQSLGAIKPGTQPQLKQGSWATVVVWTVQFANEPKYLHAFLTTDRNSAICHVRAQSGFKVLFTIQSAMQRCSTELQAAARNNNTKRDDDRPAGVMPSTAPAQNNERPSRRPATSAAAGGAVRPGAPPPAASADRPPAYPDNWNGVAEVLFRTSYTGGVGGMLVVEYEPVILFKDGTYFEIAKQALEDVDLAGEKAARPVHWGTWKAQNVTYILTDNKGRPHDYKLQDGNLFKAFPAEAGGPLNLRYKRVTGGGNAALGGEISILVQSTMAFTADGRFGTAQDMAMTGSGDQSGVSMAGGSRKRGGTGTYKVHHHTIELHYPDGHSERRFFAYSSAHSPATVDRELIFVGDTSYVNDK